MSVWIGVGVGGQATQSLTRHDTTHRAQHKQPHRHPSRPPLPPHPRSPLPPEKKNEEGTNQLTRQRQNRQRAQKTSPPSHEQHPVTHRVEDTLCRHGRNRTRQSPECGQHTRGGSPDRGGEGFGRVGVEGCCIGGLEKVLHRVEAYEGGETGRRIGVGGGGRGQTGAEEGKRGKMGRGVTNESTTEKRKSEVPMRPARTNIAYFLPNLGISSI